ncbi:hypothetical protein E8E13_003275 [Curvularia kusanoi]|uniref:Uncharacterized protein n=1 Tax=Curvularia kusanoi TaxID=90978 RepID=A0A9P4T6V5_CURKU|nr:hypothetical protein E8E13_003275 [Curvularia kusanoi]
MSPSAEVLLPGRDQASTTDISTLKSNITTQVHEIQPPPPNTLVLHPSFVTQDFDLLRFSAAAQNQLPSPDSSSTTPNSGLDSTSDTSPPDSSSPSPAYSTNLISSPYNTPGHYLSLPTLTPEARLFALALTALQPTRPDYATAPYTQSLSFSTVMSLLRTLVSQQPRGYTWPKTSFYVVTFHSRLAPDIDQALLYELDFESHREASLATSSVKRNCIYSPNTTSAPSLAR